MTRILNILSDTNIGGAGRVLLNYLQYADRTRFEVRTVLPPNSLLRPPLEQAGGVVLEAEGIADRSYSREGVHTLRQLIAREGPGLVHTHGCLSGRIAARREGVPVVYSRHSAFPVPAKLRYPPGRWVNKLVNEHYADKIIAVSPAAAKNLTDAGISPKKIVVMMNGVAPVARRPQSEQDALRRQWGLEEGDFVLGILARLEDYKGHMDILQALHILTGQGRRVKLLIAGTGPYEPQLRAETARLGLEGAVRFLGFVTDVAPLLSVLDLQLNASYGTETSSLSILEGLSMGLPAVVSEYGGNPWLIDHGEDGLRFPTRDAAALAKAVARLMDDREELARMGQRGVEIFHARFTGEIMARNIEKVYLDVLKGAK